MTTHRPDPATILVVDDDAAVRQILGRVLAREGHTVYEAGDATRAVELTERHQPQLAVLDLCLGDGDGSELAGRLQARRQGLPLILITGYPLRLHEKPELSRPFLRVATKPVDVNELRLAVHAALSEGAMQQPNPSPTPHPVATPPANGSSPVAAAPQRSGKGAGFMSTAVVVVGLLVLAGFVAFVVGVPIPGLSGREAEALPREPPPPNVRLVAGKPHTVAVPEDVRVALGIRKGGKDRLTAVEPPAEKVPLALSGSTALDPTGLMRVRARFAPAEVVAIGTFEDNSSGATTPRELRPGDVVHKDQPLATFYSVDVGTKKNDLVDALVSHKLDQELLDASQRAYDKGAIPALDLVAARSKVQGDVNAINKAENTLRAWNVPPEDIEAVRKEAQEIIKTGAKPAQAPEEREKQLDRWARVVLKAPGPGTIVEMNFVARETVVDNTINLFQIARVDPLQVIANAPEDELPRLQALLDRGERRCKVRTVGAAGDIDGTIDNIGYLIDVNQHSAVVKGHIPNRDGRLRSGQFVTASVELAPPDDVVEVPMSALVDDGRQAVVFVREDPNKPDEFTMRRVEVTRRFERRLGDAERVEQRAFVRCRFDDGQNELPPEAEGLLPRRVLKPDDHVITAGVLELKKELEDRESELSPSSSDGPPSRARGLHLLVRKLIGWGLDNPLIVLLLAAALAGYGVYAFVRVNVEAYPDPAPAIIEIIAQYPGASAEEVERQVTIPLEVTLAGMPGLKSTRTKSLFGLAHLRNQFDYGIDYDKARQEVINRLQFVKGLPPGVAPDISPETPTGEIYRYTLSGPKDASGQDVYTLNDLKALQDWVLEREFRRVPGIIDVTSSGGTVKRYEIHPDPDRMKQYGITLGQIQSALAGANANVGGDYSVQGDVAMNVRCVGLIGGGEDPVSQVLGLKDPDPDAAAALERAEHEHAPEAPRLREGQRARLATAASARLRAEEERRIREIRSIVLTSINSNPILLEDVVEGGRLAAGERPGQRGVVVGYQTRLGRVGLAKPKVAPTPTGIHRVVDANGKLVWRNEDDKVQCIVLLRKGEDSLPTLKRVEKKVEELNSAESGKMLPGVLIKPYYDRTDLINVTTETVRENLLMGMALVSVILLMFLSNVRSAVIVAINIPLALLFAFAVLYLRGKSANLLSIGAVDFGIIVDSSVIMVENIYRHISSGEYPELPLKARILHSGREVERALFFSTAIMVCAFLPLFTMTGPEGQIFGPMADTYAFALGGALLLSLLLAPVLCLLLFKHLKPSEDNFLVRFLRAGYVRQLELCLNHPWITLVTFLVLLVGTVGYAVPNLGREFMPELEEGNLWIRGTFPLNASLERVTADAVEARAVISSYPEVESVVPQIGRPDDGTDPTGFYNVEVFVPLRPQKDWPLLADETGWRRRLHGARRPRGKEELVHDMNEELNRKLPGVDWNFSQNIRDNVMEALSGVKGDNSVKIFGPDLEELEAVADKLKNRLKGVRGVENVGVFSIKGQTNLEFRVDLDKCKRWGVSAADVNNAVQTALAGKSFTTMIEGEKLFDVTVRWPKWRRATISSILDIPVDVVNHQVILGAGPGPNPSATGFGVAAPPPAGSQTDTSNPITNTPRLRLRDLVSPVGPGGAPDPSGRYEHAGASTIYREQGNRLIAVKFSVHGRDLAGGVAEAKEATKDLIQSPYRAEWSGEFQEMEEAEHKLVLIVSLSLALILVLLYLAFRSFLDAAVIFANVLAMSVGGVWALLLTGVNFNISAAVGFISILGVAIMNGLLMVSAFNRMRAQGRPPREAIVTGVARLVRPVTMTALAAIFGMIPAAFSTRIGSQSQRPLAIVVVGGMVMTLVLLNLLPVLYSFYGHREPPEGAGGMDH